MHCLAVVVPSNQPFLLAQPACHSNHCLHWILCHASLRGSTGQKHVPAGCPDLRRPAPASPSQPSESRRTRTRTRGRGRLGARTTSPSFPSGDTLKNGKGSRVCRYNNLALFTCSLTLLSTSEVFHNLPSNITNSSLLATFMRPKGLALAERCLSSCMGSVGSLKLGMTVTFELDALRLYR